MALQVWLPFNGNLENKGLSNITITNNGATIDDNGKIGKCYTYTTSQYMQITNLDFSSLSSCSISFWLKVTAKGGSGWLPFTGQTTSYYIMATSAGTGAFYHGNAGSGQKIYKDGILNTTPGALNEWHHYCITGVNLSTWTKFYINKYSSAWNFAGSINDLRIYNHILSPKEVHEISKGLVIHYKLDNNNLDNTNINLLSPSLLNSSPAWKNSLSGTEIYKDKKAVLINSNGPHSRTSSGANTIFPYLTFKPNTQYTLSVTWCDHLRTDSYSSSMYLRFRYDDGTLSSNLISPTANNNADWTHAKITSAAGKTVTMICSTYGRGGKISIADIKLEEGTIDTGLSISTDDIKYEYLQSDGAAYINTGIPYNSTKSTYKIECKFSMPATVGSYDAIFGAYTAEANKCLRIIRGNGNSTMWTYYNNQANSGNRVAFSSANTNIREVVMTSPSTILTQNGTTTTYANKAVNGTDTTSTFYLFCQGIVNDTLSCISKARIYYFKLYDNDIVIRHFIPCAYHNEQYGMLDLVSNQFYPNSNTTGSFIIGPQMQLKKIYDCSGYKNHANIIGTLTTNTSTPRYNYSSSMNNTSTANHIESEPIAISDNIFTVSFWVKAAKSTSQVFVADPKIVIGTLNSLLYVVPTSSPPFTTTHFVNNEWNHIVVIRNDTTYKAYINGIAETQSGTNNYYGHSVAKLWLLNRSTNNTYAANTSISDFRVYATELSEEDIKELYDTPTFIDNHDNLLTYEFNEYLNTEILVKKTGMLDSNEFIEEENEETRFFNNKTVKSVQLLEI